MRLCGIETEYGVAIEGRTPADQMQDAAELVACHQGDAFVGWDYALESPLADLRGFVADHLETDPQDAQWDEGRVTRVDRADRVLTNGARFYNDHGHPEYATPECDRLMDLVAHDAAGERIVLAAAKAYSQRTGRAVMIYKNNTDFHGAAYGTHESYLMRRTEDVATLIRSLVPFLVVRQLLVGGGKVGSETGEPCPYQLSQRAEFFSVLASVDTLYRRPLFNTRDEPHADRSRWMRLHVIVGDANRMQWCTAMKAGMTALVLDLFEMGEAPTRMLADPVRAMGKLSKAFDAKMRIELEGGSWTTPLDLMESYLAGAERFLRGRDAETDWVLSEWRLALVDLEEDVERLADRVDWVAKRRLLEKAAGESADADYLRAVDLAYSNVDPSESLFEALGSVQEIQTIVPETRVLDAMTQPPATTRARLRGEYVRDFPDKIRTVGWRRIVLKSDEVVELPVEPTA